MFESLKGFFTLQQNVNKADGDREEEGVISDLLPELKLNLDDTELINLKNQWIREWSKDEAKIKDRQEKSLKYWVGKSKNDLEELTDSSEISQDNLIFEALETFLPQATKQNPEPLVTADNTEEGIELAGKVTKILAYLADTLRLKLKLKMLVRHWSIYFFGVMKIGWSEKTNDIVIKNVKPDKLILDPDASIEEGQYCGEYIGEYKTEKASVLVERFPSKKGFIKEHVEGKMGTKVKYVEWWTDEYLFWTLRDEVLDKVKNPHFNYDREIENPRMTIDENGEEVPEMNEYGEEVKDIDVERGTNHFPYPRIPYFVLSVFNLGDKPYDDTSLIEQNIPQQDIINKRHKQIDENVDNMNSGWVVSLQNSGLTREQASRLAKALQKGAVAIIPSGIPSQAIDKITGSGLPGDVFNNLADMRNELRGVFGVTGLTAQGIANEDTVRGKIITRGQDSDRIGGGISEYLEQFADQVYNYMLQMIHVYYDEEHVASVIGNEGAVEYISIKNSDLNRKITVSVKEGSLIPKDSLTKRNEAIDLWSAGAIDPITLYERLDFPNPRESAEKLIAWKAGQLYTEQQLTNPQIPGQPTTAAGGEGDLINQVPIQ